jgi:hypothetical protein
MLTLRCILAAEMEIGNPQLISSAPDHGRRKFVVWPELKRHGSDTIPGRLGISLVVRRTAETSMVRLGYPERT